MEDLRVLVLLVGGGDFHDTALGLTYVCDTSFVRALARGLGAE